MSLQSPNPSTPFNNVQKSRRGFKRLWHAILFSVDGWRAGWQEPAFRLEVQVACVAVPLAFWLGRNWVEVALLAGSVVLVMAVELLNTGIESAIDRVGPEWHELAKRGKDMGSGAVMLVILIALGIWLAALWQRFVA